MLFTLSMLPLMWRCRAARACAAGSDDAAIVVLGDFSIVD